MCVHVRGYRTHNAMCKETVMHYKMKPNIKACGQRPSTNDGESLWHIPFIQTRHTSGSKLAANESPRIVEGGEWKPYSTLLFLYVSGMWPIRLVSAYEYVEHTHVVVFHQCLRRHVFAAPYQCSRHSLQGKLVATALILILFFAPLASRLVRTT